MKRIRIGKDISMRWEITTDGVAIPLDGRDLTVEIKSPAGIENNIPYRVEGNILIMTYYGYEQKRTGEYSITLWEKKGKPGQNVVDVIRAFELVRTSPEENDFVGGDLQVESVDLGTENFDILTEGGYRAINIDTLHAEALEDSVNINGKTYSNESFTITLPKANLDSAGVMGASDVRTLKEHADSIAQIKTSCEENAADIERVSNVVDTHESRLGGIDAEISSINTEVSTLQSKVDENTTSISQINNNIADNNKSIAQIKTSCEKNASDISVISDELGTLNSRVDTNTADIASLNTEVSALQSKVDENTTSISQINNNIADHDESITQINTKLEEHTESINAKITTDRIEDGAVTSEKIATTAFDSTLSVSGKIAPANIVGEKFTELEQVVNSKLDKRMSEDWQNYETEVKTGALLSSSKNTQYSNSAFCNTSFSVQEGERYRIKGWSVNSDYCGLWLRTNNSITRLVTAVGAFEEEITIPSGILSVGVNAKMSGTGSLSVEKWVKNEQTSEEFYKRIDAIADSVDSVFRPHKYGIEIKENSVTVFIKGYDDMRDAFYKFVPKSKNGLWDFYGMGKVINNDKDVKVSSPGSADITWLSVGDTDYISPSVVYAKTNADGDFPDTSTQKLTGGWHMYNNATSGNYTPTARNVSFKVFCDGVQVRNSGVRGNDVRIEIVNRLQGSNTEKADGTGREIVEQRFIITFDGFKAVIKGETIALEDVYYHTYYGLSAYYSISQNSVFFLGSRTDRGGHSPLSSLVRSADKYGYGIRQLSGTDVFDTVINTSVDVGSFYADRASWSIQISSRKAYPFLIYAASTDVANMLALNAGEQFTWEGYYDMHPSLL